MEEGKTKQAEVLPAGKRPISIEDVARLPEPGLSAPSAIRFSPDDRLVTFLSNLKGGLTQALYAFDPATGEQHLLATAPGGGVKEGELSLEEQLLRERTRQMSLGITHYQWDRKNGRILIPLNGSLYLQDAPAEELRLLLDCGSKPAQDAQFSPDGSWVSYVQDAEIYLIPAAGGEARQLTEGARGSGKTHGLAEYIAQEEMGRLRGYWWSPDSRQIAYTEVDETHIPVYRIIHQGKDAVGVSAQEDHRYPFAGAPNAVLRLGVIGIEGGATTWMDYTSQEYEYLARVEWLPDGSLAAQMTDRAQSELLLACFDPQTGQRRELLRERSEVWVNLHNLFKPLKKRADQGEYRFVWGSERSGYRHLYLYDLQGRLLHQLTAGEWMVDELAGVDEENGVVYFTGNREDVRQRQLYAVGLEGGEIRRISQQPGMHQVVLDGAKQRYVDVYASLTQPMMVELCSLADGSLLHPLFTSRDPRLDELSLPPPEMVTLTNREGVLLYGAIYHPPASFGSGPFPTIVNVYGGPHAQMVTNHWSMTANMQAQYLASQGFLVFKLDNRGSARRGLAFEGVIKHRMGQAEVRDQVDGVRYLVEHGLTDPGRVGIFGWSYGGFMSAHCLVQAPEVFKAAAAGAPVTNFDGYDTHYTERYMSTPQENPEGYRVGSVQHYVENLEGKLLIIHGLLDENVHFRHTARLINALVAAGKPYELLLLPDSRHRTRKPEDLLYRARRMSEFFKENL